MSKQSPAARAASFPINLSIDISDRKNVLCVDTSASQRARQSMASDMLYSVGKVAAQHGGQSNCDQHVMDLIDYVVAIAKGLLDSLDVAKEGA